MPLDTGLLYGTSVASGLLHLAFPFGLGLLVAPLGRSPWLLVGLTVVLSYVIHFLILLALQASSCDGVKDVRAIGAGAAIGAGVVAIMSVIPVLIEPLRLIVSQLGGLHVPLLTPEQREKNTILATAALALVDDEKTTPDKAEKKLGLGLEDFEAQTFREQTAGVAYWAAFGGLYGVGLGSLVAAVCPASQ